MLQRKRELKALMAGAVVTVLFHCALAGLLLSAGFADAGASRGVAPGDPARRRPSAPMSMMYARRASEGVLPRHTALAENSFGRRPILATPGRRRPGDLGSQAARFIEMARGRRGVARTMRMKVRGVDFGQAADTTPLQAMLVPRLGMKQLDPRKLPRLTKYEQPEKVEDGINISADNPDGGPLRFKEFDPKQAQEDKRRRKKPSLADLIDAPDEDDPRKRPTMLEDIIGSPEGQVWGVGSEGKEGDIYLAQVENAIREAFKVPVFLTRDDLNKLVVEIEIRQMDAQGRVVAYSIRRKSASAGFDSAAIEAVKRFVLEEGGARNLPEPAPEMLQNINKRGILVRLEGRKMQ